MGIIIFLFFISASVRAEGWLEPAPSVSEEWVGSQGSELMQKYFKKEEPLIPSEPEDAPPVSEFRGITIPEPFAREVLGREEPWVPPTSFSLGDSSSNPYSPKSLRLQDALSQ
jgi:hypothetical protein